jgi:hypothetical protein
VARFFGFAGNQLHKAALHRDSLDDTDSIVDRPHQFATGDLGALTLKKSFVVDLDRQQDNYRVEDSQTAWLRGIG